MVVLSKYYDKSVSYLSEVPLSATQAAYVAAGMSILVGAVYPRLKGSNKAAKKKKCQNTDEKNSSNKSPAVNKQFFDQLKKLLKVQFPYIHITELLFCMPVCNMLSLS